MTTQTPNTNHAELTRHGWTQSDAAKQTGTPFSWRDPVFQGLYRERDALRIARERESEASK